MRPHEPSSRHVSRLHDILTAGVRCVKPTVQLSFSCATPERPRQPSSRKVAVSIYLISSLRPREERRPPGRASQGTQADVREGGAVGPQEGVHVRQARGDDGTVRGRFLPASRREDRQLDDQPEGGRGETMAPAQGGQRRHREEADTVVAEVRRPLHRARRNAHRGRAVLGRRQEGDGQRVPSAPRLRPHRGGPVERPAIGGRPAVDRRRVPPLVGGARPSRRSRGVPQDFDDVRICATGLIGGVSSPRGDVRDGAIRRPARTCSRLPAAAACRRLTSPPR